MFGTYWSAGELLMVLYALKLGAAMAVVAVVYVAAIQVDQMKATMEDEKTPLDAFTAALEEKSSAVGGASSGMDQNALETAPVSESFANVEAIPALFRRKQGVTTLGQSYEAAKVWRQEHVTAVPKRTRATRKRAIAQASPSVDVPPSSKFDAMM